MADDSSTSDIVVSLQADDHHNGQLNSSHLSESRLRTVDWNAITEKLLLTSIINHEAHKRTKLKNKTKWEMVVNDLFNHDAFKGFLPVQADSVARKFKRLKKEFEDKYLAYQNEHVNVDLDTERMTEIDELIYNIRKDELADLTDEHGNIVMKPRRASKSSYIRGMLSDGYSPDGMNEKGSSSSSMMMGSGNKTIHDTVRDVLHSMLSLEDSDGMADDSDENPMKRMKLDEVERERILRVEGELVAAKTQERLSKTITDLYEDNRSLRDEIKRMQQEIDELKSSYA